MPFHVLRPPLPVQTPVLNRLGDVFRLDLLAARQIADRPGNFKYPNKDLLYVAHAYPEFVPTVTIRWAELVAL